LQLEFKIKHLCFAFIDSYLAQNEIKIEKLQLLGAIAFNMAIKVFFFFLNKALKH